jgi:excisionase family DNA binding protein
MDLHKHRRPLTTGEAAPRLKVSRETARAWAASGRIPAERTLGGWQLDPDAVDALAAEREREQQ